MRMCVFAGLLAILGTTAALADAKQSCQTLTDAVRLRADAGLSPRTKTGLAACNRAVRNNPTDAESYDDRGTLHQRKGKIDLAKADFAKAIDLNPKFAKAYCNRCGVERNHDQGLADCTKAIDLDPNSGCYVNRGSLYYVKKDYDRAIADLTKAIELNPKSPYPYVNRCAALIDKREPDRALADCNKGIEMGDRSPVAYGNRAQACWSKGDHARAIADANTAIKIDPKYGDAYLNRARGYLLAGKPVQAQRDIRKSLRLSPKDADSLEVQTQITQALQKKAAGAVR